MKRFLTGMLCAGILTSQPAVTYAARPLPLLKPVIQKPIHRPQISILSKDGPQVLISRDSPQC